MGGNTLNSSRSQTTASAVAPLTILAILGGLAACSFLSAVLIPIVLSLLLCLLLDPLVAWGASRGLPRSIGAPIVILIFVGIAVLLGWLAYGIFANLATLAGQLPRYAQKIHVLLESVKPGQESATFLMRGLNSVFVAATMAFLVPILALFFLLDKPYLTSRLRTALQSRFSIETLEKRTTQMLRGYVLGNLAVGAGTTLGFFILFSILKLEHSVALAFFSGFINLIPFLGAILGAVLPALQATLQFNELAPVLIILAVSVGLHLTIANFVIPKIVGSRVDVNASAAMVGLLFWGWVWGAIGLLVAIPLTAIIRIVLTSRTDTKSWGKVVAEPEAAHKRRAS